MLILEGTCSLIRRTACSGYHGDKTGLLCVWGFTTDDSIMQSKFIGNIVNDKYCEQLLNWKDLFSSKTYFSDQFMELAENCSLKKLSITSKKNHFFTRSSFNQKEKGK